MAAGGLKYRFREDSCSYCAQHHVLIRNRTLFAISEMHRLGVAQKIDDDRSLRGALLLWACDRLLFVNKTFERCERFDFLKRKIAHTITHIKTWEFAILANILKLLRLQCHFRIVMDELIGDNCRMLNDEKCNDDIFEKYTSSANSINVNAHSTSFLE